ncbi:MAG: hypothetical protein ACXV5F_07760 [Halobacteriota archaeon]
MMEEEGGEMGSEHMGKGWMMSGEMGSEHMKRKWMMMKMLWDKLDDKAKKQLMGRMLDERIMKKECKIKLMQHKLETMQMMKQWLEK